MKEDSLNTKIMYWIWILVSKFKKFLWLLSKNWNKRYDGAMTIIIWGLPNAKCKGA